MVLNLIKLWSQSMVIFGRDFIFFFTMFLLLCLYCFKIIVFRPNLDLLNIFLRDPSSRRGLSRLLLHSCHWIDIYIGGFFELARIASVLIILLVHTNVIVLVLLHLFKAVTMLELRATSAALDCLFAS